MNIIYFTKQLLFSFSIAVLLMSCDTAKEQPSNDTNTAQTASETAGTQNNEQEFKDAPDFTLKTMEGEEFTLSDQQGRIVVLNFWATWCAPCRKEIPDFMELHEELNDNGVLFAGVSLDEEGWEKVRPYAEDMGINYPIMVDDGSVSREYGPIRAIPTTFIINKKGQVEYVAPGMLTKDKLQPLLEKLAAR
ncbi:TlpA family protein disulfide reductase [Fodinibius sp.]|uniref:TlpA family protein disulfide reductase n=1 Tax=Fodinibius sp. TaxID=1872440 RepID=UPI003564D351